MTHQGESISMLQKLHFLSFWKFGVSNQGFFSLEKVKKEKSLDLKDLFLQKEVFFDIF
jgi:hypothetical protein